jgi:hypothetical protein
VRSNATAPPMRSGRASMTGDRAMSPSIANMSDADDAEEDQGTRAFRTGREGVHKFKYTIQMKY